MQVFKVSYICLLTLQQNDRFRIGAEDLRTTKGGYALVTLPRIVTLYRDSVDVTRARVTYQKLVTLRACSVCCRYLL